MGKFRLGRCLSQDEQNSKVRKNLGIESCQLREANHMNERRMTMLQMIRKVVSDLKPGQRVIISFSMSRQLPTQGIFETEEPFPIRILEGIMGSAFEIFWERQADTGDYVFSKVEKPLEDGRRTFVSSDMQELYRKENNYWVPIPERIKEYFAKRTEDPDSTHELFSK